MPRALFGMMLVLMLPVLGCQRTTTTAETPAQQPPAPPPVDNTPAPEVLGNWTIVDHHIPRTSAMTEADAAAWRGRNLRLNGTRVIFGEKQCEVAFQTNKVDAAKFIADAYHVSLDAIPPLRGRGSITVTQVSCGARAWAAPGAVLIPLGADRLLAPWDGVFFELQRGPAFRAVGQEPGWLLDFRPDGTMRFEYAYGESATTAGIPRPETDPATKTRTFRTAGAAGDLVVVVEPKACADAMSGLPFETTVTVTYLGTSYRGCGWEMPR
jgi:hypothetical protein